MTTTPSITIYVRHSKDCKYEGDELWRRCDCRKWLRWTQDGVRKRVKANTRSWAEAEQVKRDVEAQLSGKTAVTQNDTKNIRAAVEVFIAAKEVEGLSADLIRKYHLWLGRLASFCEAKSVYALDGVTGEIVIGFCKDWQTKYPSALTRSKLRERYKSFMSFCAQQGWVTRLPTWPKVQADDKAPTMPLTNDEYEHLLDAVYVVVKAPQNGQIENQTHEYWCKRVRGLFLLMRWSGLSIMDALTLPRTKLLHTGGKYRVVTKRTKTGTDVSVVLPSDIAEELIAIPNDNPEFFFWSGAGSPKSICGNWGKRFIVPCFAEAGIESAGHMKAHRLRDTFAVDLLQKGVSLEDVSKLLGHTNVRTTEKHYAPWIKGRQDRLDAVVEGTWAPASQKQKRLNVA